MSYQKVAYALLVTLLAILPTRFGHPATAADDGKVQYVKASIPQKIFHCLHKSNLTRCMKMFLLARLELRAHHFRNSGNITSDFMEQILGPDEGEVPYNYYEVYATAGDEDINARLLRVLEKFFVGRSIQLRVIPGVMVRIVPSEKNILEFAWKKDNTNEVGEGRRRNSNKHKGGYGHMMEIGLPLLALPPILFSTFLPFMIPALKMATIFSGVLNNGALLAAVMYIARQVAIENEQKQTVYFNPGYN